MRKAKISRQMSKKASELMTFWWFLVLAIIGFAVIIGVLIFASNKIDARTIEADILASKIIDCMSGKGYLTDASLKANFDIYSSCSLNQKTIESGNYFIKISIYDSSNKSIAENSYGNSAFEKDCLIGVSNINAPNYPKCVYKEFFAADAGNNKLKLNIIAGSNSEHRTGE